MVDRERLARTLWKPWHDADFPDARPADDDDWADASERVKQDYRGLIDVILKDIEAQGFQITKLIRIEGTVS